MAGKSSGVTADIFGTLLSLTIMISAGLVLWAALELPGTTGGPAIMEVRIFMGTFALAAIALAAILPRGIRERPKLVMAIALFALISLATSFWYFQKAQNIVFG